MQSVTVIGGAPCPACGGRYKVRTPDNVALCISCWGPKGNPDQYVDGKVIRGMKIRRTAEGFEIERVQLDYLIRHAIA
jgi:hypothetical protein